jgi:predicted O-methyltransferase YrrM
MEDKFPNWFKQTAQENFERFLIPLAGQDYLQFLQLGAYTGDASVWMLDFVLQGEGSRLTDVDTWQGSDEEIHKSMDFDDVYNTYLHKIDEYEYQVSVERMTSTDYLLTHRDTLFDFIYIDADHTTVGVLLDAELSWPLLKSGGIMAFDDYTWGSHLPAHLAPKLGINLFIARHQGKFETLAVNGQVWIRKL